MEQNSNNIVDIHYLQTGKATATDKLGMREMQAKAYEARNIRFSSALRSSFSSSSASNSISEIIFCCSLAFWRFWFSIASCCIFFYNSFFSI